MKHKHQLLSLCLAAVISLSSCKTIEYDDNETPQDSTPTVGTIDNEPQSDNRSDSLPFTAGEAHAKIWADNRLQYNRLLQLEDFPESSPHNALSGYGGSGYAQMSAGEGFTFDTELPESQHYLVGLKICAVDSVVVLSIDGTELGAFYANGAKDFSLFYLDGIYIEGGKHSIRLQCEKGIAFMDSLEFHDAGLMPRSRFDTAAVLSDDKASKNARSLMTYLTEHFGKRILTGQTVTPNTNAEINAVYAASGRFPAIRVGDLAQYTNFYYGDNKNADTEANLALDWADKGGIVSFNWMWYAPTDGAGFGVDGGFSLAKAVSQKDVSKLDDAGIEAYVSSGELSREGAALLRDIDSVAEKLQQFADKDIPVLLRPLQDGGIEGLFWWNEAGAEAYVWLWQTLYNRLVGYHGLHNLIWVWSGEDTAFYPGDNYADLTSVDVWSDSDTSNLPRFFTGLLYGERKKLVSLTECSLIPDPDVLNRDGALWSWFSLYRGDVIINPNGSLNDYSLNTVERIKAAYNHELTLTLDEVHY
ncbi:MAG: glycoside hydrolase family 26 protein [Oscillospiraceae bacterium]|jgi:mannan endo-1,4-beta-mannosidase|nr:glycoside hydrolase family 26 protein [Oscillospiraceae bacterium]